MRSKKSVGLVAILALFAVIGVWQNRIVYPYWKKNYVTSTKGDYSSLSPDQLLASLAGFREMVAGILWVRADSFFDSGNYDAILPIIRLVTMLDPKQIDVYATGMWHIAYNFTDEESRSDRRYIPSALALGSEGAKNNPQTYELFYETGWLWYHKIDDDYGKAVYWIKQASERSDMQTARKNLLSNVLQRDGQVEEAAKVYYDLLAAAERKIKNGSKDYQDRANRDTLERNYDVLLVRMAQRGYFAAKGGYYDQGDYDTKPPFDVGFSAQVVVEEPKVIRVIGTWNVLPVGTRVRIVLRDAEYPNAVAAGLDWDKGASVNLDPPKDRTIMQDALFVRNRRFSRRIDMSRDPTMYPFTAKKYYIDFYYNPRSAPAHIQDKFGWNGEGMTDQNYLNTEIREGQRVIFARFELTRDQIVRRGEWAVGRKTPIFATKGFQAPSAAELAGDIILVPGLRNETGTGAKPSGAVAVPATQDPAERGR